MYAITKRVFDLISSLGLLVLFSPVFVIVPWLIKLDSPGPVFYRQKRVGQHGKEFYIYKFRTMVVGSDKLIRENEEFRKKFKKKTGWKLTNDEDPRITTVGKWLRRFSLDELPQIFNIIRGEMSLVGPRAYRRDDVGDEIKEQLALYPHLTKDMELVLSVKPGLTGPWQTSGRNQLPWDERVRLDAEYAQKQSFWYDLYIVFKTPTAMLSKW